MEEDSDSLLLEVDVGSCLVSGILIFGHFTIVWVFCFFLPGPEVVAVKRGCSSIFLPAATVSLFSNTKPKVP